MGISHSWNGTVLTITSDSGTSSADLKGDIGIRGPQGAPGVADASSISYADIGAAPGGYGLGTNSYNNPGTSFTKKEDVDAISGNSFFAYRNTTDYLVPNDSGTMYVYGVHYQYTANFAKQIAIGVYHGCVIERNKVDGVWGEWEYSKGNNVLNREYRTTERYKSKVVYSKLVNCGEVAAGAKTLTVVTDATAIVRYSASYVGNDGTLRGVPYANPTSNPTNFIDIGLEKSTIYVYGGTGYSSATGTLYLQIWYTKD